MPSFGDILSSIGGVMQNSIPGNYSMGGMAQPQQSQQPDQPQQQQPGNDLLSQLLASIGIHPHQNMGGPNYLGMLGPQRGPGY